MEKDTGNYDNGNFVADEKIAYTYDENDRLQTETKRDGSDNVLSFTEYQYDGTTQIEKAVYDKADPGTRVLQSKTTNTYNEMGRLEKVEIDSDGDTVVNDTLIYTYDAGGLRVRTDTDGTTTLHLFDKRNRTGYAQVIEEGVDLDADGRLDANEIERSFMIGHDVLAQVAAGEMLTLLYDLHGSTRALVDSAGQIKVDGANTQAFSYDAYGNLLNVGGYGVSDQANALTSLLYSGEFTNAVTGQQYLRARFYSSQTGRFNRLDPFAGNLSDPLSLHKYLYTHGNPVMGTDPSGLFSIIGLLSSIGTVNAIHGIYDGVVLAVGTALEATIQGVRSGQSITTILLLGAVTPALAGPLAILGGIIAAKALSYVVPTLAQAAATFIGRSQGALRTYWARELGIQKLPTHLKIHHFVEQHNAWKFGRNSINSVKNTIPIPEEFHDVISGVYSSGARKLDFFDQIPDSEIYSTLRDYVKELDWDGQYSWGREVYEHIIEHGTIEGFDPFARGLL